MIQSKFITRNHSITYYIKYVCCSCCISSANSKILKNVLNSKMYLDNYGKLSIHTNSITEFRS